MAGPAPLASLSLNCASFTVLRSRATAQVGPAQRTGIRRTRNSRRSFRAHHQARGAQASQPRRTGTFLYWQHQRSSGLASSAWARRLRVERHGATVRFALKGGSWLEFDERNSARRSPSRPGSFPDARSVSLSRSYPRGCQHRSPTVTWRLHRPGCPPPRRKSCCASRKWTKA